MLPSTRVSEQIVAEGEIRSTNRWGRGASRMNRAQDEGSYVVFEVLARGGDLDDLERQLRLADDIVRHKLIRCPIASSPSRALGTQAPAPPAERGGRPPWQTTPSPSSQHHP